MKKILVLLSILSFSIYSFSQEKITGFGKLQLGMSSDIIMEIGYPIIKIKTPSAYINKVYKNTTSIKIFKFISDTITFAKPKNDCYLDNRVEHYYIPFVSITENIKLEGVELVFFENKLITIKCNSNSLLKEALDLKYGNSTFTTEEEKREFVYTYTGNTITKTDVTYTYEWATNSPNVTCIDRFMKFHNSKGEPLYLTYTKLHDSSYDEELRISEKRIEDRGNSKKTVSTTDLLKGF
ncbi:MAG: hypothetical protein RBR97_20620 [Bacteroidales bacterium]|jgi:hypothetical protein|nr:hypothetical protein [Bacteroidales bacterium]